MSSAMPAPPPQRFPVAGYLAADYAAVIVVTVVPAARLLGRVPRRPLLLALVLTFALSNALVGFAPDSSASPSPSWASPGCSASGSPGSP